mgnify:FL=1
MPETTKTFADMEILQGADYDMTLTLDDTTNNKTYLMVVTKDFTGATNFGGTTIGDGTTANPYRAEITETNVSTVGQLVVADGTKTIDIKLYAQWTETLDDNFDGRWEIVERHTTPTPDTYSRIAQGDFYVDNSSSRYATISA